MDENMKQVCEGEGVDFYDLHTKLAAASRVDVKFTLAELRILQYALEVAGGV